MDELIRKYAEILKNVKVGDFTYEGILSDFAREVLAIEREKKARLAKSLFPIPGRYGIRIKK